MNQPQTIIETSISKDNENKKLVKIEPAESDEINVKVKHDEDKNMEKEKSCRNINAILNDGYLNFSAVNIKLEQADVDLDVNKGCENTIKTEPLDDEINQQLLENEHLNIVCATSGVINSERAINADGTASNLDTVGYLMVIDKELCAPMYIKIYENLYKYGSHSTLSANNSIKPFPLPNIYKQLYVCKICNSMFGQSGSLEEHIVQHKSENPNTTDLSYFVLNYMLQANVDICNSLSLVQCDVCDKFFSNEDSLNVHKETHSNGILFKCDVCSKVFSHSFNFKSHMLTHKESHQCHICGQIFGSRCNLSLHIKLHSDVKCVICKKFFNRNFLEPQALTSNNFYTCYICRNSDKKCMTCGKIFNDVSDLNKHVLSHNNENSNVCDICDESFSQADALKQHMLDHTVDVPFQCDICNKRFGHIQNLKSHLKTHSQAKLHVCDTCGMCFGLKRNLNKHMTIHTIKVHQCDVCDDIFANIDSLRDHLRTHKDGTMYMCNMCGSKYNQTYTLKSHIMKVHKNQQTNKYKCDICLKWFDKIEAINDHMTTHKDEDLFTCDICNRSFGFKRNLKIHLLIHSKTFKCDLCDRCFNRQEYLNRHKLSHSDNDNSSRCKICRKTFSEDELQKRTEHTCGDSNGSDGTTLCSKQHL